MQYEIHRCFCSKNVSSFFSSKNITVYAIYNDQSFNDTLTNDIVSFEQLGPGVIFSCTVDGFSIYVFVFLFVFLLFA